MQFERSVAVLYLFGAFPSTAGVEGCALKMPCSLGSPIIYRVTQRDGVSVAIGFSDLET